MPSTLLNALGKAGLTMDDIKAYEMEVSNRVTAMVSESIDACAAWSPFTLDYEYAAGLVAAQTATDLQINLYQTEDSNWFDQESIRSGLEDGTLRDYYQQQQQNFIDTGLVEEEVPLDDYILFDVIEEALQQ